MHDFDATEAPTAREAHILALGTLPPGTSESDLTILAELLEYGAAFAEANADAADASTLRVIRALEECQQKDPSRDMRSRCAAALRQIGVRPLQPLQ